MQKVNTTQSDDTSFTPIPLPRRVRSDSQDSCTHSLWLCVKVKKVWDEIQEWISVIWKTKKALGQAAHLKDCRKYTMSNCMSNCSIYFSGV